MSRELVPTTTDEIYEHTRYRLVLRTSLMMAFLIALVSILSFTNEKYKPLPDIVAVGVCLLSAAFLVKTKRYKIVGGFAALAAFIIIISNLFLISSIHYTTPLWMLVHVLYCFIVLNKTFGLIALALNFGSLFYYVYAIFPENLHNWKSFTKVDALLYMLEFVILAIAIGYILFIYVSATQASEQSSKNANKQLNQQNQIISRQKEEMEVMLKEIHHRVKNNLQIISSLLRLQSETLDETEQGIYVESVNRISAMAIIHEKMYQSNSLANFNLEEYIVTLLESLFDNYYVNGKINYEINVTTEKLGSKSIVPVAMMLNELVSNSVKHAFSFSESPWISLTIADLDTTQFMIEYADNGKWIENEKSSFGLEIIEAMTQQLDGTQFRRTTEEGTFYIFRLHKID